MVVWTILLALVGVAGLALLIVGLRGRRIDDHPICRRCGFDLVGLPEGVTRCSECGAELSARRATRHGHRKRVPALIIGGLAPLLILLSVGGIAAYMQYQNLDVQRLKPTWWLMREARDTTPGAPIAAWTELTRRMQAGDLSAQQARGVADVALDIQADKSRTWNMIYGDFVQKARGANILSAEQWKRYARNAPTCSVELRPKVRKGDPLPYTLVHSGARVGNNCTLYARIRMPEGSGELIPPPRKNRGESHTGTTLSPSGSGRSMGVIELDGKAVAAASPGVRTASFDVDIEIREGWGDEKPLLAKWSEHLTASWELVPADTKTVEVIDDPSLRPAMEKAFSVQSLAYQQGDSKYISLNFDIKNPPAPVAYDVFLRTPDGHEESMSSINATGSTGYGTGGMTKQHITAEKVDLIFRPSLKAALNTVNMTKMWNGEIVIKDVPLKQRSDGK